MNDEILRGNYKLKTEINLKEATVGEKQKIKDELKNKALASLGGSMVYVERDKLQWDGNDDK